MDNLSFSKGFAFYTFTFSTYKQTDMSGGTMCHHIGYIRKGWAEFKTENETIVFREGDLFYTPPALRYRSFWHGDPQICYESYAFSLFPDASNSQYPICRIPMTDCIRQRHATLSDIGAAHNRADCAAVGALYALLAEILPIMEPITQHPKGFLVRNAQNYIHRHPDFTVPELAHVCGISESGLYAAFKEVLGRTPVEEKNRVRIEQAVTLLRTTDLAVEEISSHLGFGSSAFFRRVLKKETGKTPREIRTEPEI